jgi:hypothetical protein
MDSDIKVLYHVLLTLASDHDEQKTNPYSKFFIKNKSVESNYQLIMKLPCPMQHRR